MIEKPQILAHDECVKELLVHDIVAADRPILPRIVDRELQDRLPPRQWASGMVTTSVWNSTGSGTPATKAIPQRRHFPALSERTSGSIGQL